MQLTGFCENFYCIGEVFFCYNVLINLFNIIYSLSKFKTLNFLIYLIFVFIKNNFIIT